MKPYQIVIEPTRTGFSAYSPDVPGCISTGRTRDEVEANMREALEFHLEGLRLADLPIPSRVACSGKIEATVPIEQQQQMSHRGTETQRKCG